MAKPQHSPRSRLRASSHVNDNHCVNSVTGQKNSVCVTGQTGLKPLSVVAGDKKVTLNLNVDFCVANAHIVTRLPQRKGRNPNCCQMYTEVNYVKDVSCIGHLSSVNLVTNAPPVVTNPPVGTRLQKCWEKWEALGSSPKVVTTLREGYILPFRFRPNLTRSPTVISNYHNPARQSNLLEALYQLVNKNAVEPVENQNSLGFYNRLFLVPKPNNRWRPILDLSTLNTFLNTVVQDGDPRVNKNLPTGMGVGHFHRLQRRVLQHTYSQSVQEVHAFSPPGSVLPIQSPTLWPLHSSHGVHSGSQRGQTHGTAEGYKDPPVPRRLVGESLFPRNLSPTYTELGSSLPKSRLASEQGKVRAGPKTGFQLRRLPVRPKRRQGQTHTRALAGLDRQDPVNTVRSGMSGPTVHVPHRSSHCNRKASPPRATSHEAHTVAVEKQLEGPRITRQDDPSSQVAPPPPKVVAGGKQCTTRSTFTPSKTCSANIYRRIKRRVGRSLRRAHCKGNLVPSRKQVAHKSLRAKSCLSSSKRVSKLLLQQDSIDSYRQHNSGCLYQQRGGDEIGLPVWRTVENPVLVHQEAGDPQGTSHPRPAERNSRRAIQTGPDHSNRVVTSSRSVQSYMLPVAPATSGPVCHQIQQQTTTVCFTGSGPPGMGSGCTQPVMGESGSIRLSTSSHLGQSGGEVAGLPLQQDYSDCPRVAQHALVLGSSGNVQSDPTVPAQHTQLSVSAFQPGPSQEPVKSEPTCRAPRASAIKEQGFSEAVAARIVAPQRGSTRSVYEAKWTIFTKWCLCNQVDVRAPPLKAIADFLLHLFQDKKLQPGTIDGYGSAIADKLGNVTINVSKDENLTRLLDSFHRDRPKGRRGIPSWNLSLVLHQLTKAPFEPLKEASLKHLTFKTVFLMALGSGKRRSEKHAWLHKNIRHQSDWSKVSLYPSPSFLSKNSAG